MQERVAIGSRTGGGGGRLGKKMEAGMGLMGWIWAIATEAGFCRLILYNIACFEEGAFFEASSEACVEDSTGCDLLSDQHQQRRWDRSLRCEDSAVMGLSRAHSCDDRLPG